MISIEHGLTSGKNPTYGKLNTLYIATPFYTVTFYLYLNDEYATLHENGHLYGVCMGKIEIRKMTENIFGQALDSSVLRSCVLKCK